jgi:choline dehydrogenase-like flavoprotein
MNLCCSSVSYAQDFNAPGGRVGVGYYHFNIKGGIRDSAARAMLAPVLKTRPNLNVKLKATVKRVLLENAPVNATVYFGLLIVISWTTE